MPLPTVRSRTIDPAEQLEAQLSRTEAAQLSDRAKPRRRAEFAAGRLAVQDAARVHFGKRLAAVARAREPRKDALELFSFVGLEPVERFPNAFVSLSHHGDLAVAAVFDRPVGIDLVERESVTADLVTTLFSPEEVSHWTQVLTPFGEQAVALDVAFAAKEAYLKILGEGLRIDPRSIALFAADGADQTGHRASPPAIDFGSIAVKPEPNTDPRDLKHPAPPPMELAGRLRPHPRGLIEVLLWEKESRTKA